MATSTLVAIAGPPGAGKTALMLALAQRLPEAAWLSMDGFPAPFSMPAEALARWLDDGTDFAALDVPGFGEALTGLKAGQAVTEPESGRRIGPAPLILIEAPLGRAHASGQAIDTLVWLDTPLDVAMARNIVAWETEGRPPGWLGGYMRRYLDVTRRVLLAQRDKVAPEADLKLDGLAPPEALAEQVVAILKLDR